MEIKLIYAVLIIIATALLFTIIGYIIRKQSAERKIRSAEEAASAILQEAEKQAKAVKEKRLLKLAKRFTGCARI